MREERLAARRERVQQSSKYCHVIDGFSGKLRSYLSTVRDTQESSITLGEIESVPFLPAGIYSEGQEILRGNLRIATIVWTDSGWNIFVVVQLCHELHSRLRVYCIASSKDGLYSYHFSPTWLASGSTVSHLVPNPYN